MAREREREREKKKRCERRWKNILKLFSPEGQGRFLKMGHFQASFSFL